MRFVPRFRLEAADSVSNFASCGGIEVRSDHVRLEAIDAQDSPICTRIISARPGGHGSSPDRPPGRNFDLLGLCLAVPTTFFEPRHEPQIG